MKKAGSGSYRLKPASMVPPPPEPTPASAEDLDATLRRLQHKIIPSASRPGSVPDMPAQSSARSR